MENLKEQSFNNWYKMTIIDILRLDHRTIRDQRITSHVALTSRAFGASSFYYTGEQDSNMEQSIHDVSKRWGGDFSVKYLDHYNDLLRNYDGVIIHLTMYGENHEKSLQTIKNTPDLNKFLVIVGGPKVPRSIYEKVDFNTAIGWQPHSEVAAIAIFLQNLVGNNSLYYSYPNSEVTIDQEGPKSKRSDRFKNK